VPIISVPSEIAMHGDILDIACPGYSKPVRLEFFGDTLDDIHVFDAATQRSVADITEVTLLPIVPFLLDAKGKSLSEPFWEALHQKNVLDDKDLYVLRRVAASGGQDMLSGVAFENASRLEEWLPKDSIFLLPDAADFAQQIKKVAATWELQLHENKESLGLSQPRKLVLQSPSGVLDGLHGKSRAYFDELVTGTEAQGADLPERAIHSFQEMFPAPADMERPWQKLVASMREWSSSKKGGEFERVLLSFANERSRAKFLALAEQDGIRPQLRFSPEGTGLFALVSPFRGGVHLVWDKTLILGEDVLQPRNESSARRSSTDAFKGLDRYDDLVEGNLLVHRDYGLGKFAGLHRMDLGGVANDYMLLVYAGDDKLYLPVDRMGLVQRYKATDGADAAPDKLGGGLWAASKDKARKAIEKIAGDLVEMYAYRKVAKGFSYHPISEMYREFEASFGFEESWTRLKPFRMFCAIWSVPNPWTASCAATWDSAKRKLRCAQVSERPLKATRSHFFAPRRFWRSSIFKRLKRGLPIFP
jgi:transcription-repair coupling factor (superfamily II helicase)